MPKLFSVILLLAIASIAAAQSPEEEPPKTLLGFFTPGMQVGIQSVEGSASVIVHTYSETSFSVAKEIARRGRRTIDAREFAKENKQVEIALARHLEESDSETSTNDTVWLMPLIRTKLGQVEAVGSDYLLVEIDGETGRKMAIRDSSVSKVYFDATPIHLLSRPTRTASSSGG